MVCVCIDYHCFCIHLSFIVYVYRYLHVYTPSLYASCRMCVQSVYFAQLISSTMSLFVLYFARANVSHGLAVVGPQLQGNPWEIVFRKLGPQLPRCLSGSNSRSWLLPNESIPNLLRPLHVHIFLLDLDKRNGCVPGHDAWNPTLWGEKGHKSTPQGRKETRVFWREITLVSQLCKNSIHVSFVLGNNHGHLEYRPKHKSILFPRGCAIEIFSDWIEPQNGPDSDFLWIESSLNLPQMLLGRMRITESYQQHLTSPCNDGGLHCLWSDPWSLTWEIGLDAEDVQGFAVTLKFDCIQCYNWLWFVYPCFNVY